MGRPRRRSIDAQEAYSYALRVAYLAYLLQPRVKRTKVLPQAQRQATSSSATDLLKDLSTTPRDTKSAKYPYDFVRALEKRLEGIIKSEDRRPEYQDPHVKRVFAIFLNDYRDPKNRKQAEESKRAEDLILMFYSRAVRELSVGKSPHDDEVKRMVDRYLALFVRLLSSVLKEKGWAEERRELSTRLATLEKKLLKHDEDLATATTATNTVEEEVPLTYDVKDMPLVQAVGHIFGMRNTMLQSDIDKYKPEWTEAAALRDLKTYQTHLNMGTRRTLSERDFDTHEAYEEWKKGEAPDVVKLMGAILQINPSLAKSSGATNISQFHAHTNSNSAGEQYAEIAKALSPTSEKSSFTLDMPDLNGLHIDDQGGADDSEENVYTFIPPEPRLMFRYFVNQALTADLQHHIDSGNSAPQREDGEILSKPSVALLKEIAMRWRVPRFTSTVLFLDCIKDKFVEQMINIEQLDTAFNYAKQPVPDDLKNKRASLVVSSIMDDRHKWTLADFSMMQQMLSALHDSLLRELYSTLR